MKQLTTLLEEEEASKEVEEFLKEVAELAEKRGLDTYVIGVEFQGIKDGRRAGWYTHGGSGSLPVITTLAAWLYGNLRGQLDKAMTAVRVRAYQIAETAERHPVEP